MSAAIPTVVATRYIAPLREGGSLPALVETVDGARYVLKFVGAGQGPKALIAELLVGELARFLGLPIPELAFVTLDAAFGRTERDPEIQDLLRASVGLNLGLRFLPQAVSYDLLLEPPPSAELASQIVWLDAFTTNVDRTPRNVNMLLVQKKLWLIDHGAALYFHHAWDDYLTRSQSPFPLIKEHTLLPFASQVAAVDVHYQARLNETVLEQLVALIPEVWLASETRFSSIAEHRAAYVAYLTRRLAASEIFVQEAVRAHAACV